MAFFEIFHYLLKLELYTLIFLWITAVINCLEVIPIKFQFLKVDNSKELAAEHVKVWFWVLFGVLLIYLYFSSKFYGFWNIIGVSIYAIWTGFAVIFSCMGLGAIDEFKPHFLKYCIRYLLCSAIFKAIFAILLYVLSGDDNFYSVVAYASNEPILLNFTDRFINKLTPSSHILLHVMAIFYLMCGAFMVHRLRNKLFRRNMRIEASDVFKNP